MFDRLFAVAEGHPDCRNPQKSAVLLMAAEGYGFEDCVSYYDHLMGHLGWRDLGKVICGGVTQLGDAVGRTELLDAEKLGASL